MCQAGTFLITCPCTIGQAEVPYPEPEREPGVVDAKKVQYCRVQVMDRAPSTDISAVPVIVGAAPADEPVESERFGIATTGMPLAEVSGPVCQMPESPSEGSSACGALGVSTISGRATWIGHDSTRVGALSGDEKIPNWSTAGQIHVAPVKRDAGSVETSPVEASSVRGERD